ncbi:hypothetical protein RKD18_000148 [Streptomyces phaeoluteigriseus]
MTGETVDSDQGKRLLGKVRGKCAKTEGAGTAWIWVEDHSGPFYFPMPFAEMSATAGLHGTVGVFFRHAKARLQRSRVRNRACRFGVTDRGWALTTTKPLQITSASC